MEEELERKWDTLKEEYPEVAKMMLGSVGLADKTYTDSSVYNEERRTLQFFLSDEFDQGRGEELFQEFQEAKSEELPEDSELLDEEQFYTALDELTEAGYIYRWKMDDGGYYYFDAEGCLHSLNVKSNSEGIPVDKLYEAKEHSNICIEGVANALIEHPRYKLTLTEEDSV